VNLENRVERDTHAQNTDQNSKPRAMLSLGSDAASLVLLDEFGNPTFKVP